MFTQNLICTLFIVILLHAIKCDWEYDNEPNLLTSKSQYEYNFGRAETESVITEETTVDDETFDDNELKKLFVRNFKKYESIPRLTTVEVPQQVKHRPRRTLRDDGKDDIFNSTNDIETECYKCYGNTSSKISSNCYEGFSIPLVKCADVEQCYTEVNPMYIKRGCILPGRVNKTFVCKCPLCNDKPSFDPSHYEYKSVNDWEYDNARLRMPSGMDLMCKVCETKGTNPTSDKSCRHGKNADYMVCAHNQFCYTNVDDETDFVSRGCINRPVYNSLFYFCNNTACNNQRFFNPKEKIKPRMEISYRDEPAPLKMTKKKNLSSKITGFNLLLLLSGALLL